MKALGYIDYVNTCQNFTIIIVKNMPLISHDNRDLITRFIDFIGNAYGSKSQEFKRTLERVHKMNSNLYIKAIAYDEF